MKKTEKDILERLKDDYNNGLISALIGAGFSKNISELFPNWAELLHDMISDLYSVDIKRNYDNYLHLNKGNNCQLKTEEQIRNEYISEIEKKINYLEIVSNYINWKGFRESVEAYIESRIPYSELQEDKRIILKIGDVPKEYIPEERFSAHKELLKLSKLQNIYTTNYENLLEFTNKLLQEENIPNLPNLVISGRELSNKIQNRNIIKLHGNLRKSQTEPFVFDEDNKLCYIIANEDYNTYKEKHEVFTYLMRIAMLQGKFMLVGFSGTDANYKGMVSWMTDVLVNQDESDTKIYIIDLSGNNITKDLQLYYSNHHVEVVNLIDEKRLGIIGFNSEEAHCPNNIEKRDILVKFFRYLGQCDIESPIQSYESNNENSTNNTNNDELLIKDTQLAKVKANSYAYRKMWKEISSHINKGEIKSLVSDIRKNKESNRFPKVVFNQENTLTVISRKPQITEDEAYIFSLAMDECGLIPYYYSQLLKDYTQLDKEPIWQLLKIKEDTLNGSKEFIKSSDDYAVYENLQRNLFHLNFETAKRIIDKWMPSGYYMPAKIMRLAAYQEETGNVYNLIADFIKTESDPIIKFYAMQIANYISNQFPTPYNIDNYFQYGIDAIGDMLSFMTQELKGKIEKPKARGWIGARMNLGGGNSNYEKSLRILRYIIDSGIFVNFGFFYFYNISSWYLVFQNLYEEFPYPCFFYSIQYNDEEVLTRIGQDFAYSPKLVEFNKDILLKSIDAIESNLTPKIFIKSLLCVTKSIYFAVEEEFWFDHFFKSVFKNFIEFFEKQDIDDYIVKNVESAIVSLKKTSYIEAVFRILLQNYNRNPQIANHFIIYCLHIHYIKESKSLNLKDLLIPLIEDYPKVDIAELMLYLIDMKMIGDDLKNYFINRIFAINIEEVSQNLSSASRLCLLVKDNTTLLSRAKHILLQHDIWHCGIMAYGKGWTSPEYLCLDNMQNIIKWTDEEFDIICNNLMDNIDKYSNYSAKFGNDPFMKNINVRYLSDILCYIDGLEEERKQKLLSIRDKVEELLSEQLSYQSLIEGLISKQSIDVSSAINSVVQGIKAKGVSNYLNELNFIIDRAIIGDGVNVNQYLKCIRTVIEQKGNEVISLALCNKLHDLIIIYMKRWTNIIEFKPVWSFNYLYEISTFLKNNGYSNSDAVKYWLTDSFVQRFVRV